MTSVTNIVELEKRVTALEAEMKVLRRDTQRLLSLQSAAMEQMVELNRRVAALELSMKVELRALEAKFDNRMDKFEGRMDQFGGRMDKFDNRMDKFESELGQVKAEQAALRRDLPGIIANTMREVLNERRRGE
jgi:chromosome segregation ATPase